MGLLIDYRCQQSPIPTDLLGLGPDDRVVLADVVDGRIVVSDPFDIEVTEIVLLILKLRKVLVIV